MSSLYYFFDVWMEELKEVANCEELDEDAWKEYYHEGLSPQEAFNEDMQNG